MKEKKHGIFEQKKNLELIDDFFFLLNIFIIWLIFLLFFVHGSSLPYIFLSTIESWLCGEILRNRDTVTTQNVKNIVEGIQ